MKHRKDRIDKLCQLIDAEEEELIELTRKLICIPTVNPLAENYRDICELLRKRLEKRGFTCKLIRAEGATGDSDRYPRWNIIARHEGKQPGQCVHFNSHTDVVAVGDGWSVDPFAGVIKDGKIYGRGACDMKGGLAASIIAAETFIKACPDYHGAIEISGTADEESGGFGGVAYLAEHGWFNPERVQHVVIPEPLNKDRICLGHRGVLWTEIETHGHIAHGSMPFLGDCAVRHMGAVMQALEQKLYPSIAKKQTAMPVVPEQARQATLNINSIHGGLEEPEDEYTGLPSALVPDRCRMVLDRRLNIEENIDEVREELQSLLREVGQDRPKFNAKTKELFSVIPTMTDKDAPIVKAVSDAIKGQLGKDPDFVISPGTYDQKHIDRIGRLKNCIAYGPGILDLAHQPDEYVGIQDMLDSAKVVARTLTTLLTPQDSS